MARMIPVFMDDQTPPGERDVFNLLANGPDDWTAIHSLDLAPSNRGLRTEIDFVIVAPDTGILCVEVKSHDAISFDGERWLPSTISRSPFKQASDGRHTFYRRLSDLAPQLRHVPVVHCCIFPRSIFDLPPNLSVQPWELMDTRSFHSCRSGDDFCAALKSRMENSIAADGRLNRLGHPLSTGQIDTVIKCCVPVQKRRPDAREVIQRRAEEIDRVLREQQKPVLQLAELNSRIVISGPAGTGKTLIAMEVARRAADNGKRVALLCFNQLVGDWMRKTVDQAKPEIPNLIVGRAIRVLAEMAGLVIPEHPTQIYWETDLPNSLEDRLTDPDFSADAAFDYLVLDEAQDLLARPRLWQCLMQFLKGGMENGAFALFGDFDHQVLTERAPVQEALNILDSMNRPSHWRLSENCRNYRIVGDTAVQLAGLRKPVYTGYLRSGGGLQNYDIYFYSSNQEQLDKLSQWLKEYKAERYRPSEITILSFRADRFSAAVQLKDSGYKLRPAWQGGDSTSYASVHAFKGLENKVIILTDVVLGDQEFHRDLFYTGMTRCTDSVRVLCGKGSQGLLTKWLEGATNA